MKDDVPVLQFFAEKWSTCENTKESVTVFTQAVLANEAIWGQNLNQVSGLTEKTADYLYQIINDGMHSTVQKLVGGKL